MSKAVEIKNLYCSLNDTRILNGIDLDIEKGEFTGLIGPNGAGKTTLLKCINGIIDYSGTILVDGKSIKKLDQKSVALKVAHMYQNTMLNFPFPALEVVLTGRYPYIRRFKGETPGDYEAARKYMRYTRTDMLENQPITLMSGGERQRVLFAKCLAQETDILLLDEPTANLDIAYEEQIFKYSLQLCKSGKSVIAAVHDLKIAAKYCTRLVLIKDGKVMTQGLKNEVLTGENISKAYEVNAMVFRNRITGLLDFYIHENSLKSNVRIHVIGGGGSASGVIRMLFEKGVWVTSGVFAHGDSDLNTAVVFNVPGVICRPFCEIDHQSLSKNIEYIKQADFTILCNMPFGILNLKNLEAAHHANKLIIIEDDGIEGRDYTGGKATEIYNSLKENAIVVNSSNIHEIINLY